MQGAGQAEQSNPGQSSTSRPPGRRQAVEKVLGSFFNLGCAYEGEKADGKDADLKPQSRARTTGTSLVPARFTFGPHYLFSVLHSVLSLLPLNH